MQKFSPSPKYLPHFLESYDAMANSNPPLCVLSSLGPAEIVQRVLRGVCIPRATRLAKDEFYYKTTLYDSQASAALAQPADTAEFEPKEVICVGNGKWINCCVALRHGCYTHLANIPDKAHGYSNARFKWSYRKGGWLCLSLWSTKAIKDEPVIVSSYGRQANKIVRDTAKTSDWLVLETASNCSVSEQGMVGVRDTK
eukprot:g75402.t1